MPISAVICLGSGVSYDLELNPLLPQTATAMIRAAFVLIVLAISLSSCSSSNTTQSSGPVAGELRVANNTDESICHLYVRPVTQSDRQVDLIESRGESPIDPGSARSFQPGNAPLLQQQVPFQVTAESCSGARSGNFEFAFERGGLFTISSF